MKTVTYAMPVKWNPSILLGDADKEPIPTKISVKSRLIKAGEFKFEGKMEPNVERKKT